jgi:23S rRNA pseudouridine1911/1915/1917 synthase
VGELKLAVPRDAAGERLDRFLARLPEVGSRAEAERLLAGGLVVLDGRSEAKSHRLAGGETLVVEVRERSGADLEPEHVAGVVVRYADEHLLVVDKPAGVAVHPGAGPQHGTLVHALLASGIAGGEDATRPGVVHRLDRDTSGLLILARDEETHRRLARLVRRRELTREYLALVRGRPRSRAGRIEAPIGRDRRDRTRMSLDTDRPRAAVTHFELVELQPAHALLRVRLETGRTHQIRVHLSAIGMPVSGDPVYGVEGDLGLARQFLHAERIAFRHPVSGEEIDVESPLPPDLAEALDRARRS